jgi:hypothetical protein
MRTYIGHQEVLSAAECWELAVGDDSELPVDFRELFLGETGETGKADETAEQRAAREQAARDILADLMEAGQEDEVDWLNAVYAAQLVAVLPLRRQARSPRRGWDQKAA